MDDEAAGREIWRCVAELFLSAENQRRFIESADELGLTGPMFKALLELQPDEARPMRSLAEDWHCDASFVTVVVDGLERHGYVVRRVAEHDRRVKTVQLTEEGAAVREQAHLAVYGPRSGFHDLDPDERTTLATLLRKLADAQAVHDEQNEGGDRRGTRQRVGPPRLLHRHGPGGGLRERMAGGGPPKGRGRGPGGADPAPDGPGGDDERLSWRDHLEVHREELRVLRTELAQMRDELRAAGLAAGGRGGRGQGRGRR